MNKFWLKIKTVYIFWKRISSREISAGLSFYFLTGLVPLLCVVFIFLGQKLPSGLLEGAGFSNSLVEMYRMFEGGAIRAISGGGGVFICTVVYSSVNLFYRFKKCGEILYEYEGEDSFFKKFLSLCTLGITVFVFSAAVAAFLFVEKFIGGIAVRLIGFGIFLVVSGIAVTVMNFSVCPYRLSLKEVYKGSLLTLLLWCVITGGFTVYLDNFANYTRLYGALGGLFALMLYVYLSMQAFTFGVAFNISQLGKLSLKKLKFSHSSAK